MRFCAILILSVISILNSLELKSQTVVKILSNGCKVERSLFLNEKKIGVYINEVDWLNCPQMISNIKRYF